MAKKRLKQLTKERVELLIGFEKILDRIWSFQSEITVNSAVLSYYEPIVVDKTPVFIEIFLDRKNRELRSVWCRDHCSYRFSSPSIVHISTFYEKYEGTIEELRELFIKMLIETLDKWTKYDEEKNLSDWCNGSLEEVEVPTYPEKINLIKKCVRY